MRSFLRLAVSFALLSSTQAFAGLGVVVGDTHPELGSVSAGGSSFSGGAVLETGIADTLMLHAELRYVNHSVSTATYDLLALPILAQLNLPLGILKPHLQTGPDFLLKLSGSGFNSTDFAWDFGAGIGLELIPLTTLFLDVRYSLGLQNVVDAPGADVKSKTWELLAGIIFSL
jgi:hypothetical protein